MINIIKKHPVISFVILTMLWSWGIWSLLFTVIKPGELLNNPPPIAFVYVILGGLGPSLVGIILTGIVDGKIGLRKLIKRSLDWKVGKWWFAILIIPIVTFLTPLARGLMGYPVDIETMKNLILPGLMIGLIAGLMEEYGWRGYLLPRLLKHFNPLVASIILGLIWGGLWHGYADYFGVKNLGEYYWAVMILIGPGILTAWSLIMTMVHKHTNGSMLLSIVMHASISSSAFIFGQKYYSTYEEFIWTLFSVGIGLVVSTLVFYLSFRIK
ncbi:CPBP family intramembrane metalloprotease [Candidatus Dojkabacteria bacterium]|nr:CPBP family intramembrane metalloprotease [Candidatus Dojkabacteria bacterium]